LWLAFALMVFVALGCDEGGSGTGDGPTIGIVGPPTVGFSVEAGGTISESSDGFTLRMELSRASDSDVVADYTVSGTAVSPAEHDAVSGSITIPAFHGSADIEIALTSDDELDEVDKTIIFTLVSAMGADVDSDHKEVTYTIVDDDDAPAVSWDSALINVGEAAGDVTLKVNIDAPSSLDVTVPFTVVDSGTAVAGTDFSDPLSLSLTIPAGSLSAQTTFAIIDDGSVENSETVVFALDEAGLVNAQLGGDRHATVLIADNDSTVFVQWSTPEQSVDENGTDVVTVVANMCDANGTPLSARTGGDIVVQYGVSGTAANPEDHNQRSSALLIRTNALSASISFTPVDNDTAYEVDETVVFTILAATAAGGGVGIDSQNEHTVTILGDGTIPVVQWTAATGTASEDGIGTVTATIGASASGADVSVPFTVSGTATAADHDAVDGTLVIPAGQTSVAYTFAVADDDLAEMETVVFTIGTPTNADIGAIDETTVTIDDSVGDPAPSVAWTVDWQLVAEDVGSFTLTAKLEYACGVDVTVAFDATAPPASTAEPGVDFTMPDPQEIVIAAGTTEATATFYVIDDDLDESSEGIGIQITSAGIATIAGIPHMVLINDNDSDLHVAVEWTSTSQIVTEGTETEVTLTAQLVDTVSGLPLVSRVGPDILLLVMIDPSGTVTAGDYDPALPAPGEEGLTVVIAANETSVDYTFSLTDDALYELDETMVLAIIGVIGSVPPVPDQPTPDIGTDSVHTVTIVSDDTVLPVVGFEGPYDVVSETPDEDGEGNPLPAQIWVELDTACGVDVTVDYTVSGTAVNPDDHNAVSGSVVIPAGAPGADIEFDVVDDDDLETPNETVVLTLSSPVNATLGATDECTVIINGEREIYADLSNASGVEDGNSWATAFVDILDVNDGGIDGVHVGVMPGSIIRIAAGTYEISNKSDEVFFYLPADLEMLGGYAAGGGGARDADANATAISLVNSECEAIIVAQGGEDGGIFILDGINILGGRAGTGLYVNDADLVRITDSSFEQCYGGVDLDGVALLIVERSRFVDNYSWFGGLYGGGNSEEYGFASITDTVFEENETWAENGGGAYLEDFAVIEVLRCTFDDNYSDSDGGGLGMSRFGSANVVDCEFTDNYADNSGGGLGVRYFGEGSADSLHVTDCSFIGNYADEDGGGAWVEYGDLAEFTGCVFRGNESEDDGGGLHVRYVGAEPSLERPLTGLGLTACTFEENVAGEDWNYTWVYGGGVYASDLSGFRIEGCEFDRNCVQAEDVGRGGAVYVRDAWNEGFGEPAISDSTFTRNTCDAQYEAFGGAIYADGLGLAVRNCVFESGQASAYFGIAGGGGISVVQAGVLVENCLFDGNRADGGEEGFGGGVAAVDAWVGVRDSTFKRNGASASGLNTAWGGGAGFWYESDGEFEGCTFDSNSVNGGGEGWAFGGGVGCYESYDVWIDGCTFLRNYSSDDGGALGNVGDWDWPHMFVDRSGFFANVAQYDGGAAVIGYAGFTMVNCVATGNKANDDGGVLCAYDEADCHLSNCSFTGNFADDNGGALYMSAEFIYASIINTILWGDAISDPTEEGKEIYLDFWMGYFNVMGCDIDEPFGQMSADPLFIDADGADNVIGTPDDNLRLSASSPCIDSGTEGIAGEGILAPWWDFDGAMRPQGEGVDIGAFEQAVAQPGPALDISGRWLVDIRFDSMMDPDEWMEGVNTQALVMAPNGMITGTYDGSIFGEGGPWYIQSLPLVGQLSGHDLEIIFYAPWDDDDFDSMTYVGTVSADGNSASGTTRSDEFGDGEWRATRIEADSVVDRLEIWGPFPWVDAGEEWDTFSVALFDENWNFLDISEPVTIWLVDDEGVPLPLNGTTTVTSEGGIAVFEGISTTSVTRGGGSLHAQAGAAVDTAYMDVSPADGHSLRFVEQPTDAVASDYFTPNIEVEVLDQYGNRVYDQNNTVVLDIAFNAGAGSLNGWTTTSTNGGLAVFYGMGGVWIDRAGEGYTLVATCGGMLPAYSVPFDITAGDAYGLAFTIMPTDTVAGQAISPELVVVVVDIAGNFVGGVNGTVDIAVLNDPSVGRATLSGTTTVNIVDSVAVFSDVSLDVAVPGYTLQASSDDVTTGTVTADTASFDILPGSATEIVFAVQPGDAVRMLPIPGVVAGGIKVEILDALGNVVTDATNDITMVIGNDRSAGAILNGTKTVAAVGGVATFIDLSIHLPEGGYTLVASMTGPPSVASVESDLFNVLPDIPTTLSGYTLQIFMPPSLIAGMPTMVTAQVTDFLGSPVAEPGHSVSLAIGDDPTAGATLQNMTPATTDATGAALFNGLVIEEAGTPFTLVASAATLYDGTSMEFTMLPDVPDRVEFTVQPPATAAASVAIAPAVEVTLYDQYDNVCTNDSATVVTLAVASGTGTLDGSVALAVSAGVRAFTSVSIDELGTFTLSADAGASITADTSSAFDVVPGAPFGLVFVDQPPSPTDAGDVFAADVTVEIVDFFGNRVTSSTATVRVAVQGLPGVLLGTTSVNAVNGLAIFSDLRIEQAGAGLVLNATCGPLVGASSNAFDIAPLAATGLSFLTQPSNTTGGVTFTPAVQVAYVDVFGNVVDPGVAGDITVAIGVDASGGTAALGGTPAVSHAAGISTFGDISIDVVGAGYTLSASDGSFSVESDAFDVDLGLAFQVAFTSQPPATMAAGSLFSVSVEVQDAGGNLVTDESHAVDLMGPTGLLGQATTVDGAATFTDVSVTLAGTGLTLDAAAAGLAGDTSDTFTVTALAADRIVFSVLPFVAFNGAPINTDPMAPPPPPYPPVEVSFLDTYGNITSTGATPVTLSISYVSDPTQTAVLVNGGPLSPIGGIVSFPNATIIVSGPPAPFVDCRLYAVAAGFDVIESPVFQVVIMMP
jgi:hypothetical protein